MKKIVVSCIVFVLALGFMYCMVKGAEVRNPPAPEAIVCITGEGA